MKFLHKFCAMARPGAPLGVPFGMPPLPLREAPIDAQQDDDGENIDGLMGLLPGDEKNGDEKKLDEKKKEKESSKKTNARRKHVAKPPDVAPEDGLPWGKAERSLHNTRVLTADDPRAETPKNFKGKLHAPQATLLYALLELERCPVLKIAHDVSDVGTFIVETEKKGTGITMQTNRCLISEKFGFGKTVAVLSLVCASKGVRPLPMSLNTPLVSATKSYFDANKAEVKTTKTSGKCFFGVGNTYIPEIQCMFKRMLSLTIVYAASSVIDQWVSNSKRFTPHLKYFVIDNVHALKKFDGMLRSNEITKYNMMFVKVGQVTSN